MAKPTITRPWIAAEQHVPTIDANWYRIPDLDMFGFGGGWTVDRIRGSYQMSTELDLDANGAVEDAILVALAVTTGSPPTAPTSGPSNLTLGDVVVWREIARINTVTGGEQNLSSPNGSIDAKAKRSIPAGPDSAAAWFGLELISRFGGGISGNAIEFLATGVLIQLVGQPSV